MSSKLETILTSDNNNLPIQHVSWDLETGTVHSRGSRPPLKRRLRGCMHTCTQLYIYIYIHIHAYTGFEGSDPPREHLRTTAAAARNGRYRPNPKDPSIQILPTLGPKLCKYYLHWATWIPRETSQHLRG